MKSISRLIDRKWSTLSIGFDWLVSVKLFSTPFPLCAIWFWFFFRHPFSQSKIWNNNTVETKMMMKKNDFKSNWWVSGKVFHSFQLTVWFQRVESFPPTHWVASCEHHFLTACETRQMRKRWKNRNLEDFFFHSSRIKCGPVESWTFTSGSCLGSMLGRDKFQVWSGPHSMRERIY